MLNKDFHRGLLPLLDRQSGIRLKSYVVVATDTQQPEEQYLEGYYAFQGFNISQREIIFNCILQN